MKKLKIGVFDSGVGGQNVVEAIKKSVPECEVVFKDDRAHLPYGNKSPKQILDFMTPIMQAFENEDVDAIVIACNTASTNILPELKAMASVPVVGFVPMIKPASLLTKTKVITVCATTGTLRSKRYAQLKEEFGKGITILEPDCGDWAELIEKNELKEDKIKEVVELSQTKNADIIVLGCTHYHWIYEELNRLSGPVIDVIQPTDAVITELKRNLGL